MGSLLECCPHRVPSQLADGKYLCVGWFSYGFNIPGFCDCGLRNAL